MPRPTLSIETIQEMNELVDEIAKVPHGALDTEDKIKLILEHTRELQSRDQTVTGIDFR